MWKNKEPKNAGKRYVRSNTYAQIHSTAEVFDSGKTRFEAHQTQKCLVFFYYAKHLIFKI